VCITWLVLMGGAAADATTLSHGDHPNPLPHVITDPPRAIENPHPIGSDPLTADEQALARAIAANSAYIRQTQNAREQFIHVERFDGDKSESPIARRASIIFYNYTTDQVIRQTVNLHTHQVEGTQVHEGANHQPPIASAEAEAALQIVLAHPQLRPQLEMAFLQASGQFLLRANQLQVEGILLVPSGRLAQAANACHLHRCLQLFLRIKDAADGLRACADLSGGAGRTLLSSLLPAHRATPPDRSDPCCCIGPATPLGSIDASNVVIDLSSNQALWVDRPFQALVFEQGASNVTLGKSLQAATQITCPSGQPLLITMTIGTRWGLCWEHDSVRGLMLSQISFAPSNGAMTLILGSAALGQVIVTDDAARTQRHLLAEGGLPLRTLAANDCPQGTLLRDATGAALICQSLLPRGYAWRGADQVQGQSVVLSAISQVGDETWTHRWVFDDDGAIRPMLGVNKNANRAINAYWRLNFDIGGSADDVAEQFDYVTAGMTRTQTLTTFTREISSTYSPEAQRFWRVKDAKLKNGNGQAISYQIAPQLSALVREDEPVTQSDLYVTHNKPCEQFVTHNPTTNGCGARVTDFVNDETLDEPASDVVLWVGTSWHQMWGAVDDAFTRTRWHGLTLLPRDFLDASPVPISLPPATPMQTPPIAHLPSPLNCSSAYQITQALSSARWQMCWEPRAGYGYRLNQITFTPAGGAPHLMLNTLHVALMFVPYDDGGPRYRDTSLGKHLTPLAAAECPGGVLLPGEVLCLVQHANRFVVYGYFSVANYYYVVQFAFGDDGSIEPSVGASGSLQRYTRDATTGWPVRGLIASNHNHWVVWRMDFDLDGAAGDAVTQFDFGQRATALLTETQTQNELTTGRFWRISDGAGPLALAYDIEPNVSDMYRADEAFTQNDFYVTENRTDEAQVSDAFGLASFVNGESLRDPVAWYGVNFHHVPRAEDDVRMPIHWQGFTMRLLNRGVTSRLYLPLLFR
jgi:primary-amine oxidase